VDRLFTRRLLSAFFALTLLCCQGCFCGFVVDPRGDLHFAEGGGEDGEDWWSMYCLLPDAFELLLSPILVPVYLVEGEPLRALWVLTPLVQELGFPGGTPAIPEEDDPNSTGYTRGEVKSSQGETGSTAGPTRPTYVTPGWKQGHRPADIGGTESYEQYLDRKVDQR